MNQHRRAPMNGSKMAAFHNAPASKLWGEKFSVIFANYDEDPQRRPFTASPLAMV